MVSHVGLHACSVVRQDHNRELQQQLAVVQKGLEEASADRDLFLKRLQQLEVDAEGSGKSPSRQGLLQQKAHLEQVNFKAFGTLPRVGSVVCCLTVAPKMGS